MNLQFYFLEKRCRTKGLIHCVVVGNAWTLLTPKNKKLLFLHWPWAECFALPPQP